MPKKTPPDPPDPHGPPDSTGSPGSSGDSVFDVEAWCKGGRYVVVQKIGGGNIGDLCADEYSNLIILSLSKGRVAKILFETYGEPDPPATNCPHLRDR